MGTEEKYNGWTNRETWALNLWLTNDEGLYNEVLKVLKEADKKDKKEGTKIIYKVDALKEYIEDLREEAEDNINLREMFKDVGSLWRVNWGEIVEGFEEEI